MLLVEINDKKTPHNMKKYFYTDGTNKFGPFTLEELKEKEITRETNVWFYELGEWKNAGVIAEIQDLFTLVPPPIQKQNTNTQFSTTRKSERNTIEIFVFSSIAYWFTVDSINFITHKLVYDWYDTPLKYFQIGTNIIFAFIPIVFALSIKNKMLKIIAIILGAFLSIEILYNNIDWLIWSL